MTLSESVSQYFDAQTCNRGQDYYLSGRAIILGRTDDQLIRVEVRGTARYEVLLDIDLEGVDGPYVASSCTCPFDRNSPCKHIWAALLAVERQYKIGPVARLTTMGPLELDECLDDFDCSDDEDDAFYGRGPHTIKPPLGIGLTPAPPEPKWAQLFSKIPSASIYERQQDEITALTAGVVQPIYVLEEAAASRAGHLVLMLLHQEVTATGRMGKPKKLSLKPRDILRLSSDLDRQICLMLIGAAEPYEGYFGFYSRDSSVKRSGWVVDHTLRQTLLPLLFKTDRVHFQSRERRMALARDEGPPWDFHLAIVPAEDEQGVLQGFLRREGRDRPVTDAVGVFRGDPGMVVIDGRLAFARWHGCFEWLQTMREHGEVRVPKADRMHLVERLARLESCPPIDWPADWNVPLTTNLPPQPELLLETESAKSRYLNAYVQFHYDGMVVKCKQRAAILIDRRGGRQIRRHIDQETKYLSRLAALGAEPQSFGADARMRAIQMPETVRTLLAEGWQVNADKKPMRSASDFKIEITSGIDWFDLDGKIVFGDQVSSLPDVLKAARKGQAYIRLGDGSLGMLPEEWIARHATLLDLGESKEGQLRYRRTQVGLVDALLAQMPEARFDETLATARRQLAQFTGLQAMPAPAGFVGELRHYQEDGLAWMAFLQTLGWGGCLADDMGLGKTIQVLALLLARKGCAEFPSLIVVPKSLVFNWVREAARFAPALSVLDYTGNQRKEVRDKLGESDVLLTTYGTLRRDIEFLGKQTFDYAILDEAQAIKNPTSLNAKSSRLIQARHRLVVTGTPVENHLGDLWSLFEFLNPGMLGSTAAFKTAFNSPGRDNCQDHASNGTLCMLQRMLRPFVLRRTKHQVAPELPDRNEQVIECVMPPKQAAVYAEMREYYRQSLLGRVEAEGLAKSKVYVLEALLRLRQAACHPGLIDADKRSMESAKLESLLPMLEELLEGGHKALVFSQFTSFLDIVRKAVEQRGIAYEYLDGKTTDRQARVDRFQSDASCRLFLISLKAGGTGLNLTAADYVFILDPWWNPAVEAQAIDRTHRIGQDKSVIAYRLIARDTVEAKILQLQQTKRDLAGAIITEANSLIRDLTREDLEILLS